VLWLWRLTALSTIFQLYILEVSLIGGRNLRPVASHWRTWSHNVVSSTPRLIGVRNHNICGERHWLHRQLEINYYTTTTPPAGSHWETLLHNVVSSIPRHAQDSNSPLYWWKILRLHKLSNYHGGPSSFDILAADSSKWQQKLFFFILNYIQAILIKFPTPVLYVN
jgi:hypothetical protein